jgi:hypothetical protein
MWLCSTFYVFEEIAETVHRGLLELGLDSVRSYCSDLFARCATSIGVDGRQVRWTTLCVGTVDHGAHTRPCSVAGHPLCLTQAVVIPVHQLIGAWRSEGGRCCATGSARSRHKYVRGGVACALRLVLSPLNRASY